MLHEIAVCVVGHPNQPWRNQEGDIVTVRVYHEDMADHSKDLYHTWITVDMDPSDAGDLVEESLDATKKHRFNLPLGKLKILDSAVDLEKMRNRNLAYQPYTSQRRGPNIAALRAQMTDHGKKPGVEG